MNIRVAEPSTSLEQHPLVALLDHLDETAVARDENALIDARTLGAIRSSGLLSRCLADAADGDLLAPRQTRDLFDLLRSLGAVDLSIARICEGHVNAAALVRRYGSDQQNARFADRVQQGALSGVWGADDAQGLHIVEDKNGLVLKGRKILASGAGLLETPMAIAKRNGAQVMLLLDLEEGERADLSRWTAQGMRASATGAVELTGVRIDPAQIVGQPDDFTRQPAFAGGAWRFCAVHLGAVERLTDLYLAHLRERQRGEDPYQLERVAHCVSAAITAREWIERTAFALAEEREAAESIVALAHMTRMVTERAALAVLETIHRGVGLMSFIRPHPIERISRDLATYLRQPAPDAAMADAARFVLASKTSVAELWKHRRA